MGKVSSCHGGNRVSPSKEVEQEASGASSEQPQDFPPALSTRPENSVSRVQIYSLDQVYTREQGFSKHLLVLHLRMMW